MRSFCLFVLLFMAGVGSALADTRCPTVSNNIESLPVSVTGAPTPGQGYYDPTTGGLIFQPTGPGNRAHYFVGVPKYLVIGHQFMPWMTLRTYPEAVVQEQSTCPILLANGQPMLAGGAQIFPTRSPQVLAPCSLITDDKHIILLSLMGTPYNVYLATYDTETRFVNIQWASGASALFVAVPQSVIGPMGIVQWTSLEPYEQALMLEKSACPLVLQGSSG